MSNLTKTIDALGEIKAQIAASPSQKPTAKRSI
jgi:hypothetical protein